MTNPVSRRSVLLGMLSGAAAVPLLASGASAATPLLRSGVPGGPTDWSVAVVESTMKRFPDPTKLGGWGYQPGFALFGTFLVYQRTRQQKYLDYITTWVDHYVDANGGISQKFNSLDSMQAGNLLVLLYQETGQAKYKTAAATIRNRLKTYPRTSEGGFWHATGLKGQLWLDGTYMSMPFLLRYGNAFGEAAYARSEAVKQVTVYGGHTVDPSGLLFHAYSEYPISWADPKTHHSSQFWCRAIGWYGMTTVFTLENLLPTDPARPQLLTILRNLAAALAKYQDPKTGRWFQVVNRGDLSANWLETSSSAMYTYILSRSVQDGFIDPKYIAVAHKGYQGVLAEVTINPSTGLTDIANICQGTNVGDLNYYLARPRATNDPHGLGAFLVMNEQLAANGHHRAA